MFLDCVIMIKKIFFLLIIIFSILLITGAVSGVEQKNDNYNTSLNSTNSSKNLKLSNNIINQISTSKSTFKAGTTIEIKVSAEKSAKSVSADIQGKGTFNFKKNQNGIWYYNLKTIKYKTGSYKLNIKAFDYKKKVHKKYTYLNVNNIPPKIRSLKSNVTSITAGDSFSIELITDKNSKKVIGKVGNTTILFKLNPINVNSKGYNNSNSNNWTFNGKISYKEIGNLSIKVYAYDSVGNVAKKSIHVKFNPVYVYWDGSLLHNDPYKVNYYNPTNAYQKSVNILSKYVAVYEGYAGNKYTLGITYHNGYKSAKVIIAYKDPFVVYHEMGHVLNWQWSEYQCDVFAYKKLGYWIL